MRLTSLCLLALPLLLGACNEHGAEASNNFNAAGQNIGQGYLGSGARDIGQGFTNGAKATGDAITDTAHHISQ
jgi:hypothetical protein